MGDDVQDPARAPATGTTERRRVVSPLSTPAGQGAACRAHEAHPGSLQLLRRERQLSKSADARRGGEAGLVQVLRRRSQQAHLTWERFGELLKRFPLPRPRIVVRIWGT